MYTGGDSLEDDFVPDDLVALSSGGEFDEEEPNDIVDTAKKRKRKDKKERTAKKRRLQEPGQTTSFADQEDSVARKPPPQLALYLASFQSKSFPTMSAIELEDIQIPESAIADTMVWNGPRTLDHLREFIVKALPALHTRLSQKSKQSGSPTLLFISGAALRVIDVTRVLKDKRLRGEKGGEVAKLFARHVKVSEHCSYLKRTKVGAAVGTPGRVGKLFTEPDALQTTALSHIIIDTTYRDAKRRNLFDIPETRDELFRTVLGCDRVHKGIREGKIQVVLY